MKTEQLRYMRVNWLGSMGLVVGIIGILLSFYFFNQSRTFKDPVILADPIRTEILRADKVSVAPIRVIKADGTEVRDDLTSVRLYFWNNGNEAIRQIHVLDDISIKLDGSADEIVDYAVLTVSRDIIGFEVQRNPDDLGRSLVFSFDILEPQDGAAIQLIYEGNPSSDVLVSGIIEGVNEITTTPEAVRKRYWPELLGYLGITVLLTLFPIMLPIVVPLGFKRLSSFLDHRGYISLANMEKLGNRFLTTILTIFIIGVITSMFFVVPRVVRERASENVTEIVPSTLRR